MTINQTQSSPKSAEVPAPQLHCYHCGQAIPVGKETCPRCQRRQMRMCFCGHKIPSTQPFCEHCGADWRRSLRMHRYVHKRVRLPEVARAGAIGCGITLLLAAFANTLIDALARREAETAADLPASFTGRLELACQLIGDTFASIGHTLATHMGGLLALICVAVVGTLTGAMVYLQREGFVHFRQRPRTHGSRVRSRRRSRNIKL